MSGLRDLQKMGEESVWPLCGGFVAGGVESLGARGRLFDITHRIVSVGRTDSVYSHIRLHCIECAASVKAREERKWRRI